MFLCLETKVISKGNGNKILQFYLKVLFERMFEIIYESFFLSKRKYNDNIEEEKNPIRPRHHLVLAVSHSLFPATKFNG